MYALNTSDGSTTLNLSIPTVTGVAPSNTISYSSQTNSEPTRIFFDSVAAIDSGVGTYIAESTSPVSNNSNTILNISSYSSPITATESSTTTETQSNQSPTGKGPSEPLASEGVGVGVAPSPGMGGAKTYPHEPPTGTSSNGVSSPARAISTYCTPFRINHRYQGARESKKFLLLVNWVINIIATGMFLIRTNFVASQTIETSLYPSNTDISTIQHLLIQARFKESLKFKKTSNRWFHQ